MLTSLVRDYKPKNIAVKLKPKSEKFVKQGHPWIYETSIVKINKTGSPGDLAIIFDQKNNSFLGIGLYDPHSPIRIKLLVSGEKQQINEAWFEKKIHEAYATRLPLIENGITGYRLVYGENDGLPGLIVDMYDGYGVMKIYSLAWLPYVHFVGNALIALLNPTGIIIRFSRNVDRDIDAVHGISNGQLLHGKLPSEPIIINEYGVKFLVDIVHGHKTGYFLDHRHNRLKVGRMSAGKSVLDVFSYSGGFSSHAAAGGALQVTSIDISKPALRAAAENVKLNNKQVDHTVIAGDAFATMQKLVESGEKYNIVVVDPPSFANQEDEIPAAIQAYKRLATLALKLTARNGMCVMASCTSRVEGDLFFDTVETGFDEVENKSYRLLEKTFHDIDHPINFPQGQYLKCGYYEVL